MSLVLTGITHRFGEAQAVADASLSVAPGEIVCLYGASGCGKTTLLRVAAGLESLQQGRVVLDGADIGALAPEKRPVGYVLQDFVLFPHLTAIDNVAFGLADLPRSERARRARAELAAVGLEGFEKRFPHQLSGGQQQRVALARAFARAPRAMLLDEPFASIDAVLRRRLRGEIRALLKARGAATILVTHDPEEAVALGDRIAVMKAGRILEAASPAELYVGATSPEGAALFSGAQRLEGMARGGVLETPFGPLAAVTLPDGPAILVVQAGGAIAEAAPDGAAVAVDSRFAGPGWSMLLEAGVPPQRLWVPAPGGPVAPGARFRVRFDAACARAFPDKA